MNRCRRDDDELARRIDQQAGGAPVETDDQQTGPEVVGDARETESGAQVERRDDFTAREDDAVDRPTVAFGTGVMCSTISTCATC